MTVTATSRTLAGLVNGSIKRLTDLFRAGRADVILVLREAVIAGPPLVELLAPAIGRCPLVLDLDDPTWIGYDSPTYGPLARLLKWPGKTVTLIDRADLVTCGSAYVARFVAVPRTSRHASFPRSSIPTSFGPAPHTGPVPVIGWVGTHSTFPYLQAIAPALAIVARTRRFDLRIIGSGAARLVIPGVAVQHQEWDLAREPADFASFDIGVYPLPDDPWARGKSALKSVQYLASGVPFVASPIGAAVDVGVNGTTHLLAATTADWVHALSVLLDDRYTRVQMGNEGRRHALQHHTAEIGARLLGDVLKRVAT